MVIKFCKKTISIIVLTLTLCLSSVAFLLTNSSVKGNTEVVNEEVAFEIDGAQVRLVEPSGIRFLTHIDIDDCTEEDAINGGYKLKEGRVYGTLLVPTKYIEIIQGRNPGIGELSLDTWETYNALNVVANYWQIGIENMGASSQYLSYGVVMVGALDQFGQYTGLAEQQYNVEMTAVSYWYDEGANGEKTNVHYTPYLRRSLAGVAATLLNSGYADQTGYLTKIVDTVIGDDGLWFSEGARIKSEELIDQKLTIAGNEGLPVVWRSSNHRVATVDSEGNITAVNYGKCVITASLGSYSTSCTVEFGIPTMEMPSEIVECIASQAYTFPQAKIYYGNGGVSVLSDEKATITGIFKGTYDTDSKDVDKVIDYVPTSSGLITLKYSYDGVAEDPSHTLEIPVSRGAVSQKHVLDLSSSDVIGDINVTTGTQYTPNYAGNIVEYVEDETEPYVRWYMADNGRHTWQMFKIQSTLDDTILNNFDFVRVKIKALSDTGTYRWRALMCSNAFITGPDADGTNQTAYQSAERLSLNEWNDVLIPMSAFKQGNGFDKTCFISVTFNIPGDGNADNIKEVQFAGFELVKSGGTVNSNMFKLKYPNTNALVTRYDADENDGKPYVSWTITGNTYATWQAIYINKNSSFTNLNNYSHVKIRIKAIGDDYYGAESPGSRKWRPFFCSDTYVIGEASGADYDSDLRLTYNEWHDVYIPMNVFTAYGYGLDDGDSDIGYFLSATFNATNGDGNSNNLSEVRIGGIEFVNQGHPTITYKKTTALFTPNGSTNHTAFTCSGINPTSRTDAGGNGGVFSNYVAVNCATAGWKNISFMFPTTINYSQYSYIEFWVYADTGTYGSYDVQFSFFDDSNYKRTFKSKTWTKVVIKASTVQAKLVSGNRLVPVNFNSTGSAMHKNVKGFYFGPIYGVGYAQ